MLSDRYNDETLTRILIARESYHPFPTASNAREWSALPEAVKTSTIAEGERHLNQEWPGLPATLFMQYQSEGNRRRYEQVHFGRRHALAALVLAECVEGKTRFLDDITNGVWLLCEESFWGIPAHNTQRRFASPALPDTNEPYVDLFASETAALLAWTYYLLQPELDSVSVLIGERIHREVRRRILDAFLTRDDFWWMGLDPAVPDRAVNNWNPWCNGNCLCAALLLESDAERRVAIVAKVTRSLERFFDAYHDDGGCDEGPSYWGRAGGSLFDCLELLYGATNGAIDIYDEPLVGEIGRYLYRVHIAGDYYVNFADGGARVSPPANLVYRYGKRISDEKLMALGVSAFQEQRSSKSRHAPEALLRALPTLFEYGEMASETSGAPLVRDAWLDGIQVMTAREHDGSDQGFYLAAKGGHNGESHNHNDIGQFVVYRSGRPVLIDVGVETYSAKTFSADRYAIWTMQSAYHNLPTIGEVQQVPGSTYAARNVVYSSDESSAQLTQDIAQAYPADAGVVSWLRTVRLHRGSPAGSGSVSIQDTFTLNAPAPVTLSLMTPCTPDLTVPGIIRLTGDAVSATDIHFPMDTLSGTIERIAIEDERLSASWGHHLYRVLLRTKEAVTEGDWIITLSAATNA